MAEQPIVVYVEQEKDPFSSGVENADREALAEFIRWRFNAKVVCLDSRENFFRNFEMIKSFFNSGKLKLFIITEFKYSSDHAIIARKIQKTFRSIAPIMIIERHDAEKKELENVKTFSYHTQREAVQYIESVLEPIPECDWLGGKSRIIQNILSEKLVLAHKSHENETLYSSECDDNHRIVAEALRIKLFPPEVTVLEFDKVAFPTDCVSTIKDESGTEKSEYDEQISRIQNMSYSERKKFFASVKDIEGYITHGENVRGFAMDARYFQSTITNEFGLHDHADRFLFNKLECLHILVSEGGGIPILEEKERDKIKARIVKGLIYDNVPNFKTPIVVLNYSADERDIFAVANRIRAERKFIPILYGGILPSKENLIFD